MFLDRELTGQISYKWVGYGNEDIVSHLHKFMDYAAGLVSSSQSIQVNTSQHTGSV